MINITKHKKLEDTLNESEEYYRNDYDLFNFYKDVFTHDLNNIFQNILTATEIFALNLYNPEELKEMEAILEILKGEIKRGSNLIFNFQKLWKLEDRRIKTRSIEGITILKKACEFLKNNMQEKKVEINIDSIFEKFYIQADDLLIDLYEKILLNAVKYNENQIADINIKISKIQKENRFYIKHEFIDNGIGITDDRKELIFQRRYMKEKRKRGMGLGLSLVKKILEIYNGEIWIEDRIPGDYSKGSNFVVLIMEAT